MSKCLCSPQKKIMQKGTGNAGKHRKGYSFSRYKRGIRGHCWKKLFDENGIKIGRYCERCKIKIHSFP